MKTALLCLLLALSLCACGPRGSVEEVSTPQQPPLEETPPAAEAPNPQPSITETEALDYISGLRQLRLDAPWESCQDIPVSGYVLWFGYGLQECGDLGRYIQEDWPCARFPAQELEAAVCEAFCLLPETLRADEELFVEQGEESYYLLPYALYPYVDTRAALRDIARQGEDLTLHFTLTYPEGSEPQERFLCLLLEQKDAAWRYKSLLEDVAN